jgi:general secretion pathway protein C
MQMSFPVLLRVLKTDTINPGITTGENGPYSLSAMPANLSTTSRISTPINALLAVLIGYVLAQLTLELLPREESVNHGVGGVSSTQKAGLTSSELAREIASAHLFGLTTAGPVLKVEPTTQVAPDTQLNLTLHGVLAYNPLGSSLAIISSGGNREVVYAIGEKIVGNTTLQAVHADRVIIRRSGKDETLRLPKNFPVLAVASAGTKLLSQSSGKLGKLPGSAKDLRNRLVKDPSLIADLVTMRPYKRNGKLIGFRILPKKDPALLASFGVQPGDVVTSVNGITLDSDRQGIAALRRLRSASNVDLIVLRGGAEIPLSISLE